MVSMDVEPDREGLFNQIYDQEHVPNLKRVPGVLSVVRYQRQELTMAIGGQVKRMPVSHPKYHALYELESPEVLVGEAWSKAVELGRWPEQVRPFTLNRQHLLANRSDE